jgi:hypothetical protein
MYVYVCMCACMRACMHACMCGDDDGWPWRCMHASARLREPSSPGPPMGVRHVSGRERFSFPERTTTVNCFLSLLSSLSSLSSLFSLFSLSQRTD